MHAVARACSAPARGAEDRRLVSGFEFAALMAPLGPFGAAPALAVAASGGADSTALALLAARWAAERGGTLLALVADHGLRPESGVEAVLTLRRLAERGIAGRLLPLRHLQRGPALAERAREARYAALLQACREAGIVHLLLGHHAADQAETVLMRRLSGSAAAGLAGMAAIRAMADVRLLRPLLDTSPGRLRATLRAAGMAWIEDPSNRDPATLRARLRARCAPADRSALIEAARHAALARAGQERELAEILAERAALYPEGFAVLSPGPLPPAALAALLQTVSGSRYAPSLRQVAPLAAAPRPATLGGARLMPAGRRGPGLLILREEAAQSAPVPAEPGALWDGRFRLGLGAKPPAGARLGALGAAASRLRARSPLPAAVLRVLPALWLGEALIAAPHLDYPAPEVWRGLPLWFAPRRPAAGAPWVAQAECAEGIAAPSAARGD
jgi:tRNA(Ile)-lysidine synthase